MKCVRPVRLNVNSAIFKAVLPATRTARFSVVSAPQHGANTTLSNSRIRTFDRIYGPIALLWGRKPMTRPPALDASRQRKTATYPEKL
jgi:hypothetical protein